jgi:crossover junction endodeoxyribonuclease RuvC
MICLGIDPGLNKTGWAVIKKSNQSLKYLGSGIIKSEANKHLGEQLVAIFNGIIAVIEKYHPSHAAIENTYVNSNASSSLKLAQARAAAIVACGKNGIIPIEYQASTIKKVISGKGNATKPSVYKMITLQLGYISPTTYDESDAVAIAMCHTLFQKDC